jgi:hypothetical protein
MTRDQRLRHYLIRDPSLRDKAITTLRAAGFQAFSSRHSNSNLSVRVRENTEDVAEADHIVAGLDPAAHGRQSLGVLTTTIRGYREG